MMHEVQVVAKYAWQCANASVAFTWQAVCAATALYGLTSFVKDLSMVKLYFKARHTGDIVPTLPTERHVFISCLLLCTGIVLLVHTL